MPKSKKPRKKGYRSKVVEASNKIKYGKFKTLEEYRKLMTFLHKDARKLYNANRTVAELINNIDDSELTTICLKGLTSLKTWCSPEPRPIPMLEFKRVSSSIMLGCLLFERLQFNETNLLTDMQHGNFMAMQCFRLASCGEVIPQANTEPVADALQIAHKLLEWAYENDRATYIRTLVENSEYYIKEHPELIAQRQRLGLGKHLETVAPWNLACFEDYGEQNEHF